MTEKPQAIPVTLAEMDARVEAWVDSPEGKADLAQMEVNIRRAQEKIARDAWVNPEHLRQVIGPIGSRYYRHHR